VFHVIGSDAATAVQGDLKRIADSAGASTPAGHFLAGSYLSGLGLYGEALRQFTELSRLSPDSPAPHEALGNVYRTVGLMDLAAAEFQRALELTRTL
jgi:Flp pilus assembly protein TadD